MRFPPWSMALLISFCARLPMIALPGAGRDEATYAYWAWHPEPAYSPLLQLLLRLADLLPMPGLLKLRLPSILAASLVLFLFDRLLEQRGAAAPERLLAVTALALTPWQLYTGSILHPDNLLLASLLAFLLFAGQQRPVAACLACGLAVTSKLSGLLFVPVALFMLWSDRNAPRRSKLIALLLLATLVLPVMMALDRTMLQAISEFGRLDRQISLPKGLQLQLLQVLLLGGPFFVYGACVATRRFLRNPGRVLHTITARLSHLSAVAILCGFTLAILWSRQVKGSWMLPALVILFPVDMAIPRLKQVLLGVSVVPALLMVLLFTRPGVADWLETHSELLRKSYSAQAGSREARVSATRSWTQRFREYQPMASFAAQIHERAELEQKTCLISDDYGLAAQLLYFRGRRDMLLQVPGDLLFTRENSTMQTVPQQILLIAVQQPLVALLPAGISPGMVWSLPHPQTGRAVQIAVPAAVPAADSLGSN